LVVKRSVPEISFARRDFSPLLSPGSNGGSLISAALTPRSGRRRVRMQKLSCDTGARCCAPPRMSKTRLVSWHSRKFGETR
jgi:hypothetical protein